MGAEIQLLKDRFEPAEEVKINARIDNSTCSKALKNCKIKLHREIVIFTERAQNKPLFS